jgi:CRISPR-associated protein Csd1
MILQALYTLAQDEGLVDDLDFSVERVDWILTFDRAGNLLGPPLGTHGAAQGKGAKRGPAKKMRVPRRSGNRSGDTAPPEFFSDLPTYVFGVQLDPKKKAKPKVLEWRMNSFQEPIRRCAADTGDEAAQALSGLLGRHASGQTVVTLPAEVQAGDFFGFHFVEDPPGTLVTDRSRVERWWRDRRAEKISGATKRCLVTGLAAVPAPKHPKINGLPGGNPQTALVSFKHPASMSYGWRTFDNAGISAAAAEACAAALNRLVSRSPVDPRNPELTLPVRNIRLPGDTVVCYWSKRAAAGSFLDALAGLLDADESAVAELYRSVWKGRLVEVDPTPFYALTLSGAQGRAVVRSWLESTLDAVIGNLALHFHDFEIVGVLKREERVPAVPLGRIVSALAVQGDPENAPAALGVEIFLAALGGTEYPRAALQRAIERARTERPDRDARKRWEWESRLEARAALIKACINRSWRAHPAPQRNKELDAFMYPNCTSPGYQLGLLMAVLERLQQAALGDNVNATLIDRFFAGASASPRAVFMRLLKTSVYHARKAADDPKGGGFAFRLERLKEAVLSRFDPAAGGIPPVLDLENQGLFILGYYQMRRWLWMPGEDRRQWELDHPGVPQAFQWSRDSAITPQSTDVQ